MVSSHFGELVRKQKEDKLRKMNRGVWLVVSKLMLLGIWANLGDNGTYHIPKVSQFWTCA